MRKRTFKIISLVLMAIILLYLIFNLKLFNKNNLMEFISLKEETNNFSFIFTIISSILIVFFLPLSWLSFFSAYFFGMKGFINIIVGATIGAVISFTIARLFSRNIMSMITYLYNKRERKYNLDYISNLIEDYGMGYIIYLRNTPLIPFSLTSYIAGASRIEFKDFIYGTIIGLIPNLLISVYFYTSVMNINYSIKKVIIASFVKICQMLILLYFFKKNFNKDNPQ